MRKPFRPVEKIMFADKADISVKAGNGGNGCVSFHREKYVPKGGPDGGDGGPGGNVILKASANEQTLNDLIYNRHYVAPNGPQGKGSDMHGGKADDIRVKVPVGTIVTNAETGEFIVDMDAPGMEFVIARGGRGGRGNARFANNENRVPRERELGEEGEELRIHLELKTIADVGLVGYPNAGKSTLLRAISAARPKVAPYPFTTLNPVVGVVEFPDFYRMTVADIPGLIDGASENVGLGHAFLKHIERTHLLLYVLDMAGTDGRQPFEDFRHLQNELELYMKGLSKRPAIVVANKMDESVSAENLELLREELKSEPLEIFPVSAENGELGDLLNSVRAMLERLKRSPFQSY